MIFTAETQRAQRKDKRKLATDAHGRKRLKKRIHRGENILGYNPDMEKSSLCTQRAL
jgi:hypothetical protein